MIIPPDLERKHSLVEVHVKAVASRVQDLVSGFCSKQGFAFLGRVKDASSLSEKLEGGRYSKWSDVDDLYACAVIIPTLSEEGRVLEFLSEQFNEEVLRARGTSRKDPEVFRFDATRFIGSLRNEAELYGPLASIQFEVQIRTAFEHAWSVSTHALAYKGGNVGWRYKRLASQLRASIEQLDQFVLGFQEWSGLIQEQAWNTVDDQRDIVEKFTSWVASGDIPAEMAPQSWVRFSENLYSFIGAVMRRDRVLGHSANVKSALLAIERELESEGGSRLPRSISLLQFCIGVMCKGGIVNVSDRKYFALITDELRTLYPAVSSVALSEFNFEFED